MASAAKKKTDPYTMDRYGIMNHVGGIWSPETFESIEGANAYIDKYQRENPRVKLDRHKVIPVRVTVEAIE